MHVTGLTVEGFVLQASGQLGGGGQFALDARSREGLDGADASACLQHRLVLGACRLGQEVAQVINPQLCGACVRAWKGLACKCF